MRKNEKSEAIEQQQQKKKFGGAQDMCVGDQGVTVQNIILSVGTTGLGQLLTVTPW